MRRNRRGIVGLLVLLMLSLNFPEPVRADREFSPSSVLIVYDSLGIGTMQEGNVEALKRLLAAFRVQVTAESVDTYMAGSMKKYSKLIEVRNRLDLMEEQSDFTRDLQTYEGDILYIGERPRDRLAQTLGLQVRAVGKVADFSIGPFVEKSVRVPYIFDSMQAEARKYGTLKVHQSDESYPYGVRKGTHAYVPFMQKDRLSEMALSYLLKDWIQPEQKSHYYLVFKEIYPFSDLALLERMSDELFEAGIPFIASVHPVFSNTDYPAMKRYMNALKYMQSRNGTILVEAPVVASTIQDLDRSLYRQMEHFIDVLAAEGIVPLGMGTEMYWSYDDHYVSEGMAFFDSVILFPDERPMPKAKRNRSEAFSSSMYSVNPEFLQRYLADGRLIDPPPVDTAITLNFVQKESELETMIEELKNSWITFEDYKNGSHTVHTGTYELKSQLGSLLLNGERLGIQADRQEASSDYVYKEQERKSFETWFNVQNMVFIVIIFITLVVFSVFLIIGNRMYKRKYYK
ncbi:hypothetical protein [Paenibacillus sp. DMB20]|uniref:hypothetical protein n=1 Tax=Paenibacillus sp. DMB20 TaxID=1642570 RepID=UPI00062807D5|nr:hypothetical protein [Paenibacillus sp. DMB20]KKO52899.1 hypothetical protein XI25_16965 [Paenibacillus sp. DMB20]